MSTRDPDPSTDLVSEIATIWQNGSQDPALGVRLEPMRRRHLRGVLKIEQQVYPRPWSLALFVSELRYRDTRCYLAARVGPDIVGYGGVMLSVTDGHITTIAVDPRWHRCGIGTRILLELARSGIDMGATDLTLEVRASNTGAQELYRRFGFAPAGIRKNYYAEINEDALIMWAHDANTIEYQQRLDAIERALPTPTLIGGEA